MRTVIPSLLAVLVLAGCTRLQSFRVVDAYTGQPISNVRAERLDQSLQTSAAPLVFVNLLHPVETASTDESGTVRFEKSATQFAFNPDFGNHKCGKAFVARGMTGVFIRYPEEHLEVRAKTVDGVIEVPMRRRVFAAK